MSDKINAENSKDHDLVGRSAVKGLLSRIDKSKTDDQWDGEWTEWEDVNYP